MATRADQRRRGARGTAMVVTERVGAKMTPDERRSLRALRDEVSEVHVIVTKIENGLRAALEQIGIAGFRMTDEINLDVTRHVVECHRRIDALLKG